MFFKSNGASFLFQIENTEHRKPFCEILPTHPKPNARYLWQIFEVIRADDVDVLDAAFQLDVGRALNPLWKTAAWGYILLSHCSTPMRSRNNVDVRRIGA
jgi:hypothetical protein